MEPRPDFFPVYVSGQYLTSEHLNETHDFLWQQEKATRYLLAGNGIVSGMQADFTGNPVQQINLSAGVASSIDGYIVQNANTIFDKAIANTLANIVLKDGSKQLMLKTDYDALQDKSNIASEADWNVFELFYSTEKIEDLPDGTNTLNTFNITSADALTKYAVFAWVFIKDAENDHCQQGDCNSKGIQRNFITRYFLIDNSLLTQMNFTNPQQNTCSVARIKNLSAAGSASGVQAASFAAWSASFAELSPYFSNSNPAKQLSIIASLLSADEQTALTNASTKLIQINASVSSQNCPQYYNAFASDLSKAINELVNFYNDYADKYSKLSNDRIESVIIIGSLRSTGVDKWRYYFIPAIGQIIYAADKKKLRKLFLRVTSLVNNFIVQSNISSQQAKVNKVLAIPSLIGDSFLQDCAIPYYYDVLQNGANNDVLNYWNPQDGGLKNIFCYYDSVIPRSDMAAKLVTADWSGDNFFRIEGHVGLAKATAISAINALIINDGLPIQLLDCDVNYKGPVKWINWVTQFSDFMKVSLEALKQDPNSKNYAYDPLKKIQTYAMETSYRQTDAVKGLLDDLTAYSGVFYNAKFQSVPAPKGKAKKLGATGTGSSVITKPVADNYVKVITQQKITDMVKGYNDAIIEVKDPNAKKMIILKDLAGLEYLGGVPRGGTFVLLHSNGTVIGDGCLSYYYRVATARVFDL